MNSQEQIIQLNEEISRIQRIRDQIKRMLLKLRLKIYVKKLKWI